jgi:hypothetical protein
MNFTDQFTTDINDKDQTKRLISQEAFSVGVAIQDLTNAINKLRSAL